MAPPRPNPDELLAQVQDAENRASRGKLRIFFGYAAGVGKTFAMLSAARREKAVGVDVVVGYVEPHGRRETEDLLDGLETIPPVAIRQRGLALKEFDLDAALRRQPRVILVDELAHTNAEGLRHSKRWQDVEELLDAGVDVWTTLNVQHLESLNDVIAQITGVVVRETLPDAVLERADDIELIDLTPTELVERLRAGKVYLPSQAERALESFFRKGNLAALRELSLRQAASRLQRDVDDARHAQSATEPWKTGERLLVCVGPSPTSAQLLRSAKRLAAALGAEWIAVSVDAGGTATGELDAATSRNLRLAERLGAETATLIGRHVAETLLAYARERNVTKIIVGKTARPWWRRLLGGNVVDWLVNHCGAIDVYVVTGDGADLGPQPSPPPARPAPPRDYLIATVVVAACGALGLVADWCGLSETNVVMFFLAGVAIASTRLSRRALVLTVVLSVLVFDVCFVPPRMTIAVTDSEYLITFAVMLGIGLLIGELTVRQRAQFHASQRLERRTSRLFRLTRQLSELSGTEFLVRTAGKQLEDIFDAEVAVFTAEPDEQIALRFGEGSSIAANVLNAEVARWVAIHGRAAGADTDTLPNATATFVPLQGSQRLFGAVGVRPRNGRAFDLEQQRLLETCGSLLALSLERDASVLDAQQAQVRAETERLRSSLLSAVSHDIRTPLAGIAGASSALAASFDSLDRVTREELLATISDEAAALTRLVENLLHMTRLSSGLLAIDRQWHVVEEVVGSALTRLERQLAGRRIETHVDDGLPMIWVDASLVEQMLINLVENAAKYSPGDGAIEVAARAAGDAVTLEVADRGRGFVPGDEKKVFEMFYRGQGAKSDQRGTGIGLAICRAVAEVHGGRIGVQNRAGGGAVVSVTIPVGSSPPDMGGAAAGEGAL